MKEHKKCLKNGDETSLLAKHQLQASHSCDLLPEILHLENKSSKLDILELFEIALSDTDLFMNEQIFVTHSPLLKIPFQRTNGQFHAL
jgi:hypothetical protein